MKLAALVVTAVLVAPAASAVPPIEIAIRHPEGPLFGRQEISAEVRSEEPVVRGTALYDYLYLALEALESRQGRRVVILLSDGCDAHSVLTLEELREVARYSRALVYWLRLPTGYSLPLTTWRSRDVLAADLERLGELVRETGGRVVTVAAAEDIAPAFSEVLAELREQHAIGYYPEPRFPDPGWRRVGVEVERRGLELRWRGAYFDR
jgi:VWFA-related protein